MEAFVDGKSITKVTHKSGSGYVLLGSSYNANLLDNL